MDWQPTSCRGSSINLGDRVNKTQRSRPLSVQSTRPLHGVGVGQRGTLCHACHVSHRNNNNRANAHSEGIFNIGDQLGILIWPHLCLRLYFFHRTARLRVHKSAIQLTALMVPACVPIDPPTKPLQREVKTNESSPSFKLSANNDVP